VVTKDSGINTLSNRLGRGCAMLEALGRMTDVTSNTDGRGITARRPIGAVLSVALSVALWFAPLHLDLTAKHALAVACFIIVAWITEVLPHARTGIIGCYLLWALNVVEFKVASTDSTDQGP
jgi:hypothetical protein